MNADDQHQQRSRAALAAAMNARRLQLHLRWKDVADRADLTTETLRQIRVGETVMRDLTRQRLEDALEWLPGSVDRVLDGLDPLPQPPQPAPHAETIPDPDVTLTRVEHPALRDGETLVYVPGRKPGTRIYGLTAADETGAQYRFAEDTPLEDVIRELRKLAGVVRAASPD